MIFGKTIAERINRDRVKRGIEDMGTMPHYVYATFPVRLNSGKYAWLQRVITLIEKPWDDAIRGAHWRTLYFANGQELKNYLQCNGKSFVDDNERVIEIVDQMHELYTKKVLELQSKL